MSRLDIGAGETGDQPNHLADCMGAPASRIERLAPHVVAVERIRDRQVRGCRVLDVEKVPLRGAVGPEHRRPAVERGADGLGDQPLKFVSPPP